MRQAVILQAQGIASSQHNLNKIDLQLAQNDVVVLIGKNTSGKEHLLQALKCNITLEHGSINFDDKSLDSLPKNEYQLTQRQLAYLNQNPKFIDNLDLFQNIEAIAKICGHSRATYTPYIEDILTYVGLSGKRHYLAANLNPLQRLKLDLARNLYTKPKALLIEDVTNQLDIKSIVEYIELLQRIRQDYKLAIVISSNEIEIIKSLATRAIVLKNGAIIEELTPFELYVSPQSTIAREFLSYICKSELPVSLRKQLKPANNGDTRVLMRIVFSKVTNAEQALAHASQRYEANININLAYQEAVGAKDINIIVAAIKFAKDTQAEFAKSLNEAAIFNEVIGYVSDFS
jgi:D-methionine transport system ATP-binding protein